MSEEKEGKQPSPKNDADNNKEQEEPSYYIARMQVSNRSSWLIIPQKLSNKYKLNKKRTAVVLLPKKDGIMLKKLNASDILG